jgi:hypothetical protein
VIYRTIASAWRCALGMVGLIAMLIPVSAATTRLDQAQTRYQGGLSVRLPASQTLTVGLQGRVVRLDVPLCTTIAGGLIVATLSGGTTVRSAHASASLTLSVSSSGCRWYSFHLHPSLAVHAGQVIQLTIARRRGKAPLWGANLSGRNVYRRGHGTWNGHVIQDFAFRTYVLT